MSGPIRRVLVVGAGTMGHSIAELCAISGYSVTLVDVSEEILSGALNKIRWSLGKLGLNIGEVLGRIATTVDLAGAARGADYVIEAVVEKSEVKREVFRVLDENCMEEVVLATNTSTIPITEISEATRRRERVVGLHFFNPPVLIRFVEIIRGNYTSEDTVNKTVEFAKSIGVDYIVVGKDVPGFVANRINNRVFMEAARLVEAGFRPEEIDSAVRFRAGLPMGVFEVLDFSGIDVAYNAMLETKKREPGLEIPRVLEEKVREGKLGMKTGEGFYKYRGVYGRAPLSKSLAYRVSPIQLFAPGINEACWIMRNGVASREAVDKAMTKGMSYPKGILEYADSYGIDRVVGILEKRRSETGLKEYEPDSLLIELKERGKLGVKSGEGFYKYSYEVMDFGPVRYEKRDKYAMITMRRPEKLNALNEEMWRGLTQAFRRARQDEVRAVLITGEGRAFCAGDDIAVMGSWKSVVDGAKFFEEVASPLTQELLNYDLPVISLVNGYAFGGGMELNMLFDVVVAAEEATFAIPEGTIGAIPPIASTLGYLLFGKRILKHALTGEPLDAWEARDLGLVDIVVPKEMLEDVGVELVDGVSRVAPLSAKAIKRCVNSVRALLIDSMGIASKEIELLVSSEDFKEGMSAFLEKRKPSWKNR